MSTEGVNILQLALLTLRWILFHRFVLLWRREYCGYIFHWPFFFSGVERSTAEFTAVPRSSLVWPGQWKQHHRSLYFWVVCFSEVNLCSVILWRWGFCDEFYSSAFFFFGIENPAPEITAVPCTSLVLAGSATNSTKSAYSPATSWQG